MFELAQHYGKGPLYVKVIAEHQDISMKYLEQLIAALRAAGFVKSVRCPNPGHILARPPDRITVSDCFTCLEGSVVTVECVQNKKLCPRSNDCPTWGMWRDMQDAVMNILESTTLKDLHKSKTGGALNRQI